MRLIKSISFCGINFHNIRFCDIERMFGKKKILICVPSGPGLASIYQDHNYKRSLMNSDINIFDSGLFTLLLKINGIGVVKYSGPLLFKNLIEYFKKNHVDSYIMIDPSEIETVTNALYMQTHTLKSKIKSYVAPIYDFNNVKDYDLLNLLNTQKPKFIIINLGSGIQEKLGAWLKRKLNYRVTIICIGAAISFQTGKQAFIPNYIDRLYLGWLARCIDKPSTFIPRYFNAFKFVKIFLENKKNIKVLYRI